MICSLFMGEPFLFDPSKLRLASVVDEDLGSPEMNSPPNLPASPPSL
jgi:hypothetical protein